MSLAPVPIFPLGHYAPALIAPAVSVPTDSEIADTLAGNCGPVILRYRFEQRTKQNVFQTDITDAIEDASITLNNFRAIVRTASFLIRPEQLPATFTEEDHVAVFAELLVNGAFTRFQRGLFKLDSINRQYTPNGNVTWKAGGSDMALYAFEKYSQGTFIVLADTLITEAVGDIIVALGLNHRIVPSTERTVIDQAWEPNTPFAKVANDLLESINYYPLYADSEGIIRSRSNVDPFLEAPDVVYSAATEPKMIDGSSFSADTNRSQYLNHVIVRVEDPAQVSAHTIVVNDDVDSRISTVNKGVTTSRTYNGDRFDCDDCRAEFGRNILRQVSVTSLHATLRTRVDPRRDAHEHYQLEIPGVEDNTKWRALNWTTNCNPKRPATTMLHEIGRAEELTLTVQEC